MSISENEMGLLRTWLPGELGYDASKLVVVGESAGAHIGTTTLMRLLARRAAVQVRAQVHICASIHYGYAPPQYCEYFPVSRPWSLARIV